MANVKISQLTPKGANLASTDLLEISEFDGSGYVTKSVTGQEIIDAAASSGGVTDVTATAPVISTGGTTPDISMAPADTGHDGYLTSTDWNTFNDKQELLVSGTNIKTINGSSVLGSGDLVVSGGGGIGIHAILKPKSGTAVCQQLVGSGFGSTAQTPNRMLISPFIPATTFTCSNLFIRVVTSVATSLAKIVIYSDLNSTPNTLLYESTDLDCSTTGNKQVITTFNFVAGVTYWIGTWTNNNQTIFTMASAQTYSFVVTGSIPNPSNCVFATVTYGTAPSTFPALTNILTTMPFIGVGV